MRVKRVVRDFARLMQRYPHAANSMILPGSFASILMENGRDGGDPDYGNAREARGARAEACRGPCPLHEIAAIMPRCAHAEIDCWARILCSCLTIPGVVCASSVDLENWLMHRPRASPRANHDLRDSEIERCAVRLVSRSGGEKEIGSAVGRGRFP